MFKKLNDTLWDVAAFLWTTLYLIAGASALVALAVWFSRHITCVNVFDKVCVIY